MKGKKQKEPVGFNPAEIFAALALLEQERTKYQFFASMSKEIQFEYNYHSDLLSISEWGAAQLGINEVIMHPKQNPRF